MTHTYAHRQIHKLKMTVDTHTHTHTHTHTLFYSWWNNQASSQNPPQKNHIWIHTGNTQLDTSCIVLDAAPDPAHHCFPDGWWLGLIKHSSPPSAHKALFWLKTSPADIFCKNSVISRMQSSFGVIFFFFLSPISVKQRCLLISVGVKETPSSKLVVWNARLALAAAWTPLSWTPSWLG